MCESEERKKKTLVTVCETKTDYEKTNSTFSIFIDGAI